jgi:hypothetical protein
MNDSTLHIIYFVIYIIITAITIILFNKVQKKKND